MDILNSVRITHECSARLATIVLITSMILCVSSLTEYVVSTINPMHPIAVVFLIAAKYFEIKIIEILVAGPYQCFHPLDK